MTYVDAKLNYSRIFSKIYVLPKISVWDGKLIKSNISLIVLVSILEPTHRDAMVQLSWWLK